MEASSCLGRGILVEQVTQTPQGTACLAFHSSGADAENGRGLLLCQVMPEPEHHDRALPVRQRAYGTDQLVPVVMDGDRIRRGCIGDGQPDALAPCGAAAAVPAEVHHDLPGIRQRIVQPAPPQVHALKRGLHRLLAESRVTS
jgi:hypothetical protein